MTDRRYFDNTTLASYKRCPREYYLRHVRGWHREGLSNALLFGLSWHAAMDTLWTMYGRVSDDELLQMSAAAFDQCWVEQGAPEPADMDLDLIERYSPRTPMVAREMLRGYLAARRHIFERMELVAAEQPFAVPLPLGPHLPSNTWYAGRMDKIFIHNDTKVMAEHKTTTDYKVDGGFRTTYLEGWYLDSQIMGYLYGGALYYKGLEQVWVDAALVHKKVHNAFKFIPVAHKWQMLESWIEDTKEWIRRILGEEHGLKQEGRLVLGLFPKQTESCNGKFGPCQFLDICRTEPRPDTLTEPPAGYVHEPWSAFDVLKLDQLLQGETSDKEQA